MQAAGAILISKTHPPEFSHSVATDKLLTGRTNNPWNPDYAPGGSSGELVGILRPEVFNCLTCDCRYDRRD